LIADQFFLQSITALFTVFNQYHIFAHASHVQEDF